MNSTTPRLIRTPADHDLALHRLADLMQMNLFSGADYDMEIACLASRIEDYEKRTVQLPSSTLFEAIRFRIEQARLMDSKDITRWLKLRIQLSPIRHRYKSLSAGKPIAFGA
ncbi:hypothetical protein [Synoicihabitans lomoniglobus]|uniref:Uncharacterized protein n=1 Tax=Synoicihabitans lomoniglobus TaxID=2909285 RepID=A0AAE9ZTE7_9BACT|nr:hypothetical protein [Opitutaceae bacterium LMO-M01]WED64830.1 hypothetical protein PXH66_20995 [Opitutaceae bacterium LMO-M01]